VTSAELFAGVDRAVFAASFAQKLRNARVDVAFTAIEHCSQALEAVGPLTLNDLYWLCRVSYVTRQNQLEDFDRVFDAIFEPATGRVSADRRGQQNADPSSEDERLMPLRRLDADLATEAASVPWATLPSVTLDSPPDDDDERLDEESTIPELRPSGLDVAMGRPFDMLDEAELQRVGELLESVMPNWPQRRSRRCQTTHSRGPIEMRRTFRRAMRTGGDVVSMVHTKPRLRPRRVVVLLDVSGSMESYARAYLHLLRPLAINHHGEIFAFATDLTRITASVRHRSATEAIEQVTSVVGDRFAGTRVATSLRTLLRHRTWSTLVRGAVVVICSDGWDADDPELLERSMRRLSLLAHRVIWVNPRVAAKDFEPRTAGMAAALPYCDEFLAGNTANATRDVIDAIINA
jgi:uncharacterized protein with von Willebrand factor type A (vWA) domain